MSEPHIDGCACDATHYENGQSAALGAADRLSLAAAPAFAIMALLTGVLGGPMDMLCSVASPLDGMTAMYVLMSLFHLSPWLRLASCRPASGQPGART